MSTQQNLAAHIYCNQFAEVRAGVKETRADLAILRYSL